MIATDNIFSSSGIDKTNIVHLPINSAFEAKEVCPKSRQMSDANWVISDMPSALKIIEKYPLSIPEALKREDSFSI